MMKIGKTLQAIIVIALLAVLSARADAARNIRATSSLDQPQQQKDEQRELTFFFSYCRYTCPSNSYFKASYWWLWQKCPSHFGDCVCKSDYDRTHEGCVPKCRQITCPANSHPVATDGCVDTIGECQCNAGFVNNGYVCEPACHPISCPANSYDGSVDGCLDSLDECFCQHGYELKYGKCVPIVY